MKIGHREINNNIKHNKDLAFSSTMMALPLFVVLVAVLHLIGYTDSANAATYSLGMTTSGTVTVDVGNVGNGTAVGTDTLTVTSTCPSGYTVSISGPSDRNLYKDGNVSNNTAGMYIAPSTGTASSPATITGNNKGTWGYSLSSNTGIGTFIGLPSTQTTLTTKASASGAGGDTIPVYYGVSIMDNQTPGNYKMADSGAITYYLTTSENCISYQLSFNANGGTGTMANQRIYEGIATPINSSTFTPPTNKAFDSWNTSADGSGTTYTAGQSVTDISAVGTTLPLYAQWKDACSSANRICYFKNAPDNEVEGTMGEQTQDDNATDLTGGSSVTLLASNFSRTGYGFAGWNTKPDYTGAFYGPMETITTPSDMSTGLPLYAVWVESAGSMQNASTRTSVCNSLTTAPIDGTANLSSVSALTDQRDNNTYAIAKLADGKCWMIENMRLDNTNSDNSTGALAQGYATNATYGNFAGLANAENPWANESTTANSLYSTDGADNTTNIGTTNAGYRFPRYNNQNTSDRASAPATGANTYSYGNYYTWAAAIADLNTYTSNNASVTNTSICPTGWHLPIGGDKNNATNSEFWTLGVATMGAEPANTSSQTYPYYRSSETNSAGKTATLAFRSYPNNFLYSGTVGSGSVYVRGSYGRYWSSTASSNSSAYDLRLNSTNVDPGTYNYGKYYGRTLRCLMGS